MSWKGLNVSAVSAVATALLVLPYASNFTAAKIFSGIIHSITGKHIKISR